MAFSTVLGQDMAVGQLKGAVVNGRISHAYLFVGPKGAGKTLAAKEMAKLLNCEGQVQGEACEDCPSCKKNNTGNHPQVHYITPSGSTIKIDQIRQLQEKIKYKNFDGFYQTIIIERVDAITHQGANSILKILEEPPFATIFILTCENTSKILPTILSRCQLIRFVSLTSTVLESILINSGIEANQAKTASLLANGDAQVAVELCQSDDLEQWREAVVQLTELLKGDNFLAVLQYLDEVLYPKLPVIKLLDLLIMWYRDIIIWKETKKANLLVNQDKLYLIQEEGASIPKLLDTVEQINKCRQELMSNTNEQMALEALLVQLAQ